MVSNVFTSILEQAQFPADTIAQILERVQFQKVKNQQKLIEPGQICNKAYFILKGGFVCRFIDPELDVERTINFYLDDFHPFMSCVDSFFSGTKTQCELRAICDSEVIVFPKGDIDEFIYQDMALFKFYHNLVSTALQEENDFKLKIISYSSERLYQYLITHCPRIIQRVPARFIAEFMGISPEWLSKLKRRG